VLLALVTAYAGAVPIARSGVDALATQIDAALADKRLAGASVGLHVVALGSGRVLYSRNATTRLLAASNQKIITAATALRELGPAYEFKTTLFAAGAMDTQNGTLRGDLILVGGGDPSLGSPLVGEGPYDQFDQWARSLAGRGIRRVTGDVVAHDGFLDRVHVHPSWPRVQLWRPYCAPVSALSLSDNCITVNVKPAKQVGRLAVVGLDPAFSLLKTVNRCKTSSKRHAIWLERKDGSFTIRVGGHIRKTSRGYPGRVTVPEPALYTAHVLAEALRRGGIQVDGEVRLVSDADLAGRAQWQPLASRRVGLTRVLEVMLKKSQNTYAEHVIKTVGAERRQDGSWEGGLECAAGFLRGLRFDPEQFTLADGSGLSRGNCLSPAVICGVLEAMDRSELGETFRDLLPVSGMDGSLKRRLSSSPYKGKVRAKTGYLYRVGALSGYAETRTGTRVAFSIMINDFKDTGGNWAMKQIEDAVVRAIVDHAE